MPLLKNLGRENITVSSTAIGFTSSLLTTKVVYARVQVQVAQIRYTEDGTDPVPATPLGELGNPGDIFEVWEIESIAAFRMIREIAVDAKVEGNYYGQGS